MNVNNNNVVITTTTSTITDPSEPAHRQQRFRTFLSELSDSSKRVPLIDGGFGLNDNKCNDQIYFGNFPDFTRTSDNSIRELSIDGDFGSVHTTGGFFSVTSRTPSA